MGVTDENVVFVIREKAHGSLRKTADAKALQILRFYITSRRCCGGLWVKL
jgi:hypothetical protein